MTWPQVLVLKTQAVAHQDVFFNLWRLRWIAHAIAHSPRDLFNGNIFYPEPNVLAFSDALLVEGVLAAPLFWLGLPPVLVHNLWLIGAIVASCVGIVVLAHHLTRNLAASLVAGVVFGFAPYRFEHYMHMELQWTVWIPWAFWALQRTIESGSWKFGLLTGGFVALQMASSVYYGVFLGVLIGTVTLVQLPSVLAADWRTRSGRCLWRRSSQAPGRGSIRCHTKPPPRGSACARPTKSECSARDPAIISWRRRTMFSTACQVSGRPERRLSPGIVAPVLALTGLLLVDTTAVLVAYLIGLALAFELSLGAYGFLYPVLYEHVSLFRGLRAPARASVYCLFFLGLLAAHATAALTHRMPSAKGKWALCALICLVVLFEYRVAPLALVATPTIPRPSTKCSATCRPASSPNSRCPDASRRPSTTRSTPTCPRFTGCRC